MTRPASPFRVTPPGSPAHPVDGLRVHMNQLALEILRGNPKLRQHGALLYLGNAHQVYPQALLKHPLFDSDDKIAWMCIHNHVASGVMLDYADLAAILGCSKPTVARCITMLRLSRWLSQNLVRDERGRMRGAVYALHDQPLSVADALALDHRYVQLVQESRRHSSVHVRRAAERVYSDISEGLHGDPEAFLQDTPRLTVLANQLAMNEAMKAPHRSPHPKGSPRSPDAKTLVRHNPQLLSSNSLLSGSALSQNSLLSGSDPKSTELKILTQSPARDPVGRVFCSSSFKDQDLTTTHPTEPVTHAGAREAERWPKQLVWPPPLRLDDNGRRILWERLAELPDGQRQAVLDEAAGAVQARQGSSNAVRNPMGYTLSLIGKAKDGAFVVTPLGEGIRAARQGPPDRSAKNPGAAPAWRQEGFCDEPGYRRFLQAYQAQHALEYTTFLGQWFGEHREAMDPRTAGFSSTAGRDACHNDWRLSGRTQPFPRFAIQWLKQYPGFRA